MRTPMVAPRVVWQRAARDGAIVGVAGALLFLLAHAVIIKPIWGAIVRALVVGAASGAVFSLAYARLAAREPRFAGARGGVLFGALASLTIVPFGLVGWMRARGAPEPFWLLVLALLLTSLYHVTLVAQDEKHRWRRLELFAALLLGNAVPAWLLTFIADFHDEPPNPLPIGSAIVAIYLTSGIALAWLRTR